MQGSLEAFSFKNATSSVNVKPTFGVLGHIFFASASNTPTCQVYDSATTTTITPITGVFTPVAGTRYSLPIGFNTGCYVVLGGTVNATVMYV